MNTKINQVVNALEQADTDIRNGITTIVGIIDKKRKNVENIERQNLEIDRELASSSNSIYAIFLAPIALITFTISAGVSFGKNLILGVTSFIISFFTFKHFSSKRNKNTATKTEIDIYKVNNQLLKEVEEIVNQANRTVWEETVSKNQQILFDEIESMDIEKSEIARLQRKVSFTYSLSFKEIALHEAFSEIVDSQDSASVQVEKMGKAFKIWEQNVYKMLDERKQEQKTQYLELNDMIQTVSK